MSKRDEIRRAKPNGYICAQYADKTGFLLADILGDLETVVNATLDRDDIYRLIARVICRLHRAIDSNEAVKEICRNRSDLE